LITPSGNAESASENAAAAQATSAAAAAKANEQFAASQRATVDAILAKQSAR
jgi:hypothetical protein